MKSDSLTGIKYSNVAYLSTPVLNISYLLPSCVGLLLYVDLFVDHVGKTLSLAAVNYSPMNHRSICRKLFWNEQQNSWRRLRRDHTVRWHLLHRRQYKTHSPTPLVQWWLPLWVDIIMLVYQINIQPSQLKIVSTLPTVTIFAAYVTEVRGKCHTVGLLYVAYYKLPCIPRQIARQLRLVPPLVPVLYRFKRPNCNQPTKRVVVIGQDRIPKYFVTALAM